MTSRKLIHKSRHFSLPSFSSSLSLKLDEFRDTFSTPFCVTNSSYFNDIPEPVSDDADSLNLGLVSDKMPILDAKKASNGFDATSYKDIRQATQLKNGMASATSNGFHSTLDDSEDGEFCHDFLYKVCKL